MNSLTSIPSRAEDHCASHSQYRADCNPCFDEWIKNAELRQSPFSHDDAVLNDIDTIIERSIEANNEVAERRQPRTFESVINEWTDTVLRENRTAPSDPHVLALILRLGVLGQRLIYEANDIGMRAVMTATREVLSGNN